MAGLLDEEKQTGLLAERVDDLAGTVARNVVPNPVGAFRAISAEPQSGIPLAIELGSLGLVPASTLIGLAQILGAGVRFVGGDGSSEFGGLSPNVGP